MGNSQEESRLLEGKYPLKDSFGNPASPELFLGIFKNKYYYEDVKKFVRRVDNDTGIPFLLKDEYRIAKEILPKDFQYFYEQEGFTSVGGDRIYLRGNRYYLNYQEIPLGVESKSTHSFNRLKNSLAEDIEICDFILNLPNKNRSLEERMVLGSLLDLYKNHLLVLFTGLYESMLIDKNIKVADYNLIRRDIEKVIKDYYQFIVTGNPPNKCVDAKDLQHLYSSIIPEKVYTNKRFLGREFDHPGRIILYAGNLLTQINEKNKKYDLLINLLNSSAEIGLSIQTIDKILNTNNIKDTVIFDVDFARYSMKDKKDPEITNYSEFENIAIPLQLRDIFRNKVKHKNTLIIDDNLNTGSSMYNAQIALKEIANSVDISAIEVVPIERVIEMIKEDQPNAQVDSLIKLRERDLTYFSIGWWRDQKILNKSRIIPKMMGL